MSDDREIVRPASVTGRTGSGRTRLILFALLAAACLILGAAYVVSAALRPSTEGWRQGPIDRDRVAFDVSKAGAGRNIVIFENRTGGPHMGQVAAWDMDGEQWQRTMLPLTCTRVHYAAGRGICLAADPEIPTGFAAYVFGPDLQVLHKLSLNGLPSRTRVSPDGRRGAVTVFASGHSYSDIDFSTATIIIDLETGETLADLEKFAVLRNGKRMRSEDFNFWGVTFAADGNRFYATLATGSETYLVEGRVDARELTIVDSNVECPSLSPDGARIAFKKRVGGRIGAEEWRLHVVDIASGAEIALAERRSIDDQVEWLDDARVLYSDGVDTWVVQADGAGAPQRFLSHAQSPAVVRPRMQALAPPG